MDEQNEAMVTESKKTRTGTWIKAVSVLLAAAVIGEFLFFGIKISKLESAEKKNIESDVTEYAAKIDKLNDEVISLKNQLSEANAVINSLKNNSGSNGENIFSLVSIAEKVKQSVVGIRVTIPGQTIQSWFYSYTTNDSIEEGSGVILTEDGYIMTNEHVITSAKTYKNALLDVIMNDGTEYEATIVGSDSVNDIAVIKIEISGLKPIDIGSSDSLKVGETVLAVGNPLGTDFAGSVTMGIVSALNRQLSTENTSESMIQTDAAINPGNSGGALVDSAGYLIGINTQKIASTEIEGLGFAIPIDYALPIARQLIEYGYVRGRITLGLSGQTLTQRYALYYDLPEGLIVTDVTENAGADLAGIKVNDVITEFDGVKINSMEDIEEIKAKHKVGDILSITYFQYKTRTYTTENIILMEDKSQ